MSRSYQSRVLDWLLACFGAEVADDKVERNHRFLEEALELVQACGCTASEAHQLVDYVYGRPVGDRFQEAGGVMNTLAALCLAQRIDLEEAAEAELERVWTKVEQIRAKQAAKPKHSPLPQAQGRNMMDPDISDEALDFQEHYRDERNRWMIVPQGRDSERVWMVWDQGRTRCASDSPAIDATATYTIRRYEAESAIVARDMVRGFCTTYALKKLREARKQKSA